MVLHANCLPACLLCLQPPGCPDYAMLSFMGGFHGRTLGKKSAASNTPLPFPPAQLLWQAVISLKSSSGEAVGYRRSALEAPPVLKQSIWVRVRVNFAIFWKFICRWSLIFILNSRPPVCASKNLTSGVKLHNIQIRSYSFYTGSIPILNVLPEKAVIPRLTKVLLLLWNSACRNWCWKAWLNPITQDFRKWS